ncbi:MAG TPA: extracellular solute-binding protein [Devosiaceae bacterium]|jgi:iron(III) transport system substrate-binding protein
MKRIFEVARGAIRVLPFAAASLMALSLGAGTALAQADTTALEAAAKAEGKVVVYHSNPSENMQPLADAFTAKYGIPVELFHVISGPLSVRFSNEAGSGNVVNDILYTTDASLPVTHPEWFTKLTPALVPNIARLKAPNNLTDYATGALQGSFILIYNTDKVKPEDAPKTWQDLGDPKWKDQIILADPRGSASYIKIMALLKDRYPGLLEKIAANNPHVVESAGPGAQQLAAGTGEIEFPALASHALTLMSKGAPLNYVVLQGPELTRNTWGSIPAKAPHPNAGQLFLNFWLSDEGTDAYCSSTAGNRSVLDKDGKLGCEKMAGDPEYLDDTPPPDDVKTEVAKELGLL